MPLELGIAMARRFMDPGHDWLVLVPEGHAYLRFVSDLAAYDPVRHDGSISRIVPAVMAWLATRGEAVATVKPQKVLDLLPKFQARREELNSAWGGYPPWPDLIILATEVSRALA